MEYLLRELQREISAGRLVPVLGESLNLGKAVPGGLPKPEEFLREISRDYPDPLDQIGTADKLPQLAAWYEAANGRHGLCQKIVEHYNEPSPKLVQSHIDAARIAGSALITLGWGHAVERAVSSTRSHVTYVTSSDIPYGENHVLTLVKILGCVSQKDSLVITDVDISNLLGSERNGLAMVYRPLLISQTLLFLGVPLDSPILNAFHNFRQQFFPHVRPAYLTVAVPPAGLRAVWQNRGYKVFNESPTLFLQRLVPNAWAQKPTTSDLQYRELPLEPYKFLDYYTSKDVPIFFGRKADVERVVAGILLNRCTVLAGSSGVGKTSLLQAGILADIARYGYRTYTVRTLDDPAVEVKRIISGRVTPDDMPLRKFLEQELPSGSKVLIAVDQFEEFFLRFSPASRRAFAEEVRECLQLPNHDIRFLFVLREDFLHRLVEIESWIQTPLSAVFRLRPFDEQQVKDAILRPAELYDIEVEPTLVNRLVQDLIDINTAGADPAHLQIICYQLYKNIKPDKVMTLELYTELGGADNIIGRYLDEAVDSLPSNDESVPGQANRESLRAVLKSMVTDEKTKAAMTVVEMTNEAIASHTRIEAELINNSLRYLITKRIIRPVVGRQGYFELAHEKLVEKIWSWVEPDDVVLKYTRRILGQFIVEHRRVGTFPTRSQWQEVSRNREFLRTVSEDEALLLMQTSLQFDGEEDLDYWMGRAAEARIDTWNVIRQTVETATPTARNHALRWASKQSTSQRVGVFDSALKSPYPAIRRQAARSASISTDARLHMLVKSHDPLTQFIEVPEGHFVFGTNDPRFPESHPAHEILVSCFQIQRFPVTNYEYEEYVREMDRLPPAHWQGPKSPADIEDHPVVNVSWFDAVEYAAWYASRFGVNARLPTAAEWEKAAAWNPQTKEKFIWSWGNEYDPLKGNTREGGPIATTPIGQYSCAGGDSPIGTADMSGNTFDWVWDWWTPRHDPKQNENPTGPEETEVKAARGGSWAGSAEGAAAVNHRYAIAPTVRNEYVGFRLVISHRKLL